MVVAGTTDWGVDVNLRGTRASLSIAIDRLAGAAHARHRRRRHRDRCGAVASPRSSTASTARCRCSTSCSRSSRRRSSATAPRSAATSAPPRPSATPLRRSSRSRPGSCSSSIDGEREVDLAEYFTGYRETVRRPDELIRAVRIPLPLAGAHRVPQGREAPIRRHLQRRRRLRARPRRRRHRGRTHRARRRRRDADPRPGHRGACSSGDRGPSTTARDAASVLGTEGTPMSRPPRERGVPLAHARHGAAEAAPLHAAHDRGGAGMSELAARPVDPVVGRSDVPHESARTARHRPRRVHRRPRRSRARRAHRVAGAVRAGARPRDARRRAGARGARRRAGAHRGRRARGSTTRASSTTSRSSPARRCSTGTPSSGCSARPRRPRDSAPPPCASSTSRCRRSSPCPRRSRPGSFQGTPAHGASRRPRGRARHGAPRLRGRHRDRRAGALLPRDARLARARRLRGAGLRRLQHAASLRDAGDRRARARRAEQPGHRAGAAHGRRLRRQGDAAARVRRDRRARGDAHRPRRCGCGSTARRTSR